MTSLRVKTLLSHIDRISSTIRYAFIGNFVVWVSGCISIPKATAPLQTTELFWQEGKTQKRLMVFLPGRADKASDFLDQGLWQTLRENELPFDAIGINAHLGYYLKGSIVDRIQKDVIEPARQKGYEEIWVVGNSLGGLGALLTEKDAPGTWHKMILLAPFLGDDKRLYKTFEQHGGVQNWNPEVEFHRTDFSPRLWLWIKDWPKEKASRPETFVGYGSDDRLKLGIGHFLPFLPTENIETIPGGHRWAVWQPLWKTLLPRATAQEKAAAPDAP